MASCPALYSPLDKLLYQGSSIPDPTVLNIPFAFSPAVPVVFPSTLKPAQSDLPALGVP